MLSKSKAEDLAALADLEFVLNGAIYAKPFGDFAVIDGCRCLYPFGVPVPGRCCALIWAVETCVFRFHGVDEFG